MLNEVKLIGRLGNDPVVKIANAKNVATLSIATWENYFDGQEWQTITEWHRVVLWDKAADHLDKLKKGDMVYVSGKIKTRKYKDPGTDVDKYVTEIHGIIKALPKIQTENHPTSAPEPVQNTTQQSGTFTPPKNNDLPF